MASESEKIEIVYAMKDKIGTYSKLVGTSICSVFHNTKRKVRIHILHDGTVSGNNREKFLKLAEDYGQEILFYNVRELLPDILNDAERIMSDAVSNARYTEASMYRLLAPQILPESIGRLIYLDADTLVHMDIKRLWEQSIGSNGIAAVIEDDFFKHYHSDDMDAREDMKILLNYWKKKGVESNNYFNAGVLLMDLKKIRTMGNILLSGLREALIPESENKFYDQNILNFYFAKGTKALPWNYNILIFFDKEYAPSREIEGIYHYMGQSLKMNKEDVRDTLFYDYFLKTPWADGRFLCHFHSDLKELHTAKFKLILAKMWTLATNAGKKKLVFAFSNEYALEIRKKLGLEASPSNQAANQGKVNTADYEADFCLCNLGEKGNLSLALPYDVDSHFYLFFCSDYAKVKVMLEQAGLPEKGYFMDGLFLLEEDCLEKHINVGRVFEAM